MEIIITGKHFEISPELKAYTEDKITKAASNFPKMTTARIVMEMERNWHLTEARLNGKNIDIEATARTKDMYLSVDEVTDKIEKQLEKHWARVHEHRKSQKFSESIRSGELDQTMEMDELGELEETTV